MKVAIVIPNWNGADFIGSTLDALANQSLSPDVVVVVDNASSDNSLDVVERHPLDTRTVRRLHNTGFAAGANAGVGATDADLVAVLNSDARPRRDWLAQLHAVAVASDPSVWAWGGVLTTPGGRVESAGDGWRADGRAFKLFAGAGVDDLPDAPYEVLAPPGAAPLFRRTAFVELGGYAEVFFMYYEDIDLALRAWMRGWRSVVVPSALVEHDLGRSSRGSNRYRALVARNSLWTYMRCAPKVHPRVLLRTTRTEFKVARRDGYSREYARGRLAAVGALPRVLRERRAIQGAARRRGLPPTTIAPVQGASSWT